MTSRSAALNARSFPLTRGNRAANQGRSRPDRCTWRWRGCPGDDPSAENDRGDAPERTEADAIVRFPSRSSIRMIRSTALRRTQVEVAGLRRLERATGAALRHVVGDLREVEAERLRRTVAAGGEAVAGVHALFQLELRVGLGLVALAGRHELELDGLAGDGDDHRYAQQILRGAVGRLRDGDLAAIAERSFTALGGARRGATDGATHAELHRTALDPLLVAFLGHVAVDPVILTIDSHGLSLLVSGCQSTS